jgi:Domain of Unknown Function (DUF1206)
VHSPSENDTQRGFCWAYEEGRRASPGNSSAEATGSPSWGDWKADVSRLGRVSQIGRKKVGKKLSAAGKAVVFAVMALTFAASASGNSKNSGQSTSDFTASIMKAPGDSVLLIAIGSGIGIAGIVFVVLGVKRSFKKELRLPPTGTARSVVTGLGVVGYVAEGIALFLVGLLFIIATANAHPRESTGLDGGLKALREQPYGVYMLAAVGAGLICYGLYLMVKAKFARM